MAACCWWRQQPFRAKSTLEDTLSKETAFNGKSVVFDINAAAKPVPVAAICAADNEETLFDGILEINTAEELEKQGFSFENLKSFLITMETLEEEISSGYSLQRFVEAKLYFDNKTKLAAKAGIVEVRKYVLPL